MENMYIFKNNENILKIFKNINMSKKEAANKIGISEKDFLEILSRKGKISKIVAYAITKLFDNEAEIEDYFDCI